MTIIKKSAIFFLGIMAVTLNSCRSDVEKKVKSEKETRPNIVLIMADDMGYSDLGCYGSEINTPNLDRLAKNGLRYTQFYNTSRCCPTRASLLTGLYPHQTGLGWMTRLDLGKPGYTGQLNDQCVTLGEVLKQAGYSTYISGKWHVNKDDECEQDSPIHNWPLHRGFDRFFGMLKGSTDYFKPENLYTDDTKIQPGKDFYFTDAINDHASQFIREHYSAGKKNPFFLYVAQVAPHWPLHAKPEDIVKYQGKYMEGWAKTRQKRYEKMLKLGVIPSNTRLSEPEDRVLDWDSLSEEKKIDMDKRMAVFAAQVDAIDQGIGRIIKTLEDQGQLENTLIIFLSDNGSSSLSVSRKSKTLEDLGTQKSYESYGVSWTNVSNTPMRYYKLYEHEGGISTPLIVHWPKGIQAKGELRHQMGHVIDFMPTFLEVAHAAYPKTFKDKSILPPEGESLVPTFKADQINDRTLFFEHVANRGVREGNWKLVSLGKYEFPYTSDWELYNLKEDRSETNNLASKYPEKVKDLEKKWNAWATRTRVFPLDGRSWDGKISDPTGVQTKEQR